MAFGRASFVCLLAWMGVNSCGVVILDAVGGGNNSRNTATLPDGGMVTTILPPLPTMTHVVAVANDDSASITFDPVDGARDYRVYPLPNDKDVTVNAGGQVVVHNGTYRCAGDREAPAPYVDGAPKIPSDAIHTMVDEQNVDGYVRSTADATLGYVFTDPGPGLTPVYALGDSSPMADSTCFFARWAASRVKTYTTSESERAQLLLAFARDDGIAFYVPAAPSATTHPVYRDTDGAGTQYYLSSAGEAAIHPNREVAFSVLSSQAPGSLPLMRAFYSNACGRSHDELAVGAERFNRIYKQGDKLPWWSLLWTGLTGPTTLVIEALDSGCPFQGHLSPTSIPNFGQNHQPFVTIDEVRAASPTTEVFLNGQHETTNKPKAVARAIVQVSPSPHPKMDFFADFSTTHPPEVFTDVTQNRAAPQGCAKDVQQESNSFAAQFVCAAENGNDQLFSYGSVLGELWVTFADEGSGTNGKFRLTAKQKANMDAATFLHVTMEVDAYSTARRYPQIIISDQDIPVQYNLALGRSMVLETKTPAGVSVDFPLSYQLQLCKLRGWEVDNQCPAYDFYHVQDSSGNVLHLAPNDEVGEHASVDHRVVFDIYTSTKRSYVFLDGNPYGCADLPDGAAPSGPVTVTWGEALFDSNEDHTFAFHAAHMQIEQRRHYDNLGFSSGILLNALPVWDETRLPCAPPIAL